MQVFAYCAEQFEKSTSKAAGVKPITCPPVNATSFQPAWLEGKRLLYFDLHTGRPGADYWLGDFGVIALTAQQVREADLGDAVVFALNCYLADSDSPMLDALLDAGASLVIGGDGQNWAGARRNLYGAALLGLWFRRLFLAGMNPLKALAWAKKRLGLSLAKDKAIGKGKRVMAARDTMGFRAYYRRA